MATVAFIIITIWTVGYNMTTAALPPHWEYDLTVMPDYSLQLFVNQSQYETVSSITYDENHTEVSRTIHGVAGSYHYIHIKNNGNLNLTNVVIFSNIELIRVIPVLQVNDTIYINLLNWSNIEILTDQGVYAHIYSVTWRPGSHQSFDFFAHFLLLLLFVSIAGSIFFGLRYIKKRKHIYLAISSLLMALVIILLYILIFLLYNTQLVNSNNPA